MKFGTIIKENFPGVLSIYQEGIDTGMATFETALPTWEDWDKKSLPFARIILGSTDEIKGWAALSPTSTRHVYRGVAELSIYVSATARGQGIGSMLMQRLIRESEAHGIYSLQAGIFPQNETSIALHHKHGFRKIGHKARIAQLEGKWYDNVLMERRSDVIGV